jgi:hypothetical protein
MLNGTTCDRYIWATVLAVMLSGRRSLSHIPETLRFVQRDRLRVPIGCELIEKEVKRNAPPPSGGGELGTVHLKPCILDRGASRWTDEVA